jgi:predicted dehydrogenase
MDLVHWLLNVKAPQSVYSAGGRFALEDDGETPDTQEAVWQYPGFIVEASIREASGARVRSAGNLAASLAGVQLCGTKGILAVSRGGYQLIPDSKIVPESAIPAWSKPVGHPSFAPAEPVPYGEAKQGRGTSAEPIDLHARHFIDCVKSRQRPIADVEDGHQVAVSCHLANLSMKLGRKLAWDSQKEEVVGDAAANSQLVRPYRKPWDDVLRSFKL